MTASVRREAATFQDLEFIPAGRQELKGVAEDVEVFEARRSTDLVRKQKVVDPVCGMELGPGEEAARLTFQGSERHFCSSECLQRFVADPSRYVTPQEDATGGSK